MDCFSFFTVISLLATTVLTLPSVSVSVPTITPTASGSGPDPTICGDIVDRVNSGESIIFAASDAYACLLSVPFDLTLALQFLDYYNTTIQFHSSLSYLRSAPNGYQQPAVDVVRNLGIIRDLVNEGAYTRQYAFEADVYQLVYQMHDMHVDISTGILACFTFASPYNLMTASVDGKQVPQVYLEEDIIARQSQPGYVLSPVVSVNGEDVNAFLTKFGATQSVGMLEPHGDWNILMSSPALDIQGQLNTLGGGLTFYPGDELNFHLANGTVINSSWLAIYTEPYYTGPLKSGSDFYRYFVAGLLPDGYDKLPLPPAFNDSIDTGDTGVDDSGDDSGIWIPFNESAAYPPNPDVLQDNLALSGGGVITGYFLNDTSVGVLSIPSFSQAATDINGFIAAVRQFILRGRRANLANVVVDLQQNMGGDVGLAFTTFRQFFPRETPFSGSRRRSTALSNMLGETFTNYWIGLGTSNGDKADFQASEWVIPIKLNADTGRNFSSWKDYSGPIRANGDFFSLTERYDLSNPIFAVENFGEDIPTEVLANSTRQPPPPWSARNIVLLTDGACSSTCAVFVEMMLQAGVRAITVGGRPETGPIQAAGGSRGAAYYDADALDDDFETATSLAPKLQANIPQNRDSGMFANFAGFTLRDQVRANDSVPLQFQYLAADCRLYWTLDNVFNMSRLWRDVAHAAWVDRSMCVPDSTGYVNTYDMVYKPPVPVGTVAATPSAGNSATVRSGSARLAVADAQNAGENRFADHLILDGSPKSSTKIITPCNPKKASDCPGGIECKTIAVKCPSGKINETVHACLPRCNNGSVRCGTNQMCHFTKATKDLGSTTFGTSALKPGSSLTRAARSGQCELRLGTKLLGCPFPGDLDPSDEEESDD